MSLLSTILGFKNLLFRSQSAMIEADPFTQGFKAKDKNLLLQLDKSLIIVFSLTKYKDGVSHTSPQMNMVVENILRGIYRQTKLNVECKIELASMHILNGVSYPAKYVIFDNRKTVLSDELTEQPKPTYPTEKEMADKYAQPSVADPFHYLNHLPSNAILVVKWQGWDKDMKPIVDCEEHHDHVTRIIQGIKQYRSLKITCLVTLAKPATLLGDYCNTGAVLYDDRIHKTISPFATV